VAPWRCTASARPRLVAAHPGSLELRHRLPRGGVVGRFGDQRVAQRDGAHAQGRQAGQGGEVAHARSHHSGAAALLQGDQGQSTGQERRKGFLDGLNSVRKNVKVVEVPTTWDQTMAQNGVEAALRANPNAKVIACAWDGSALGAKVAMMASGKRKGSIKIAGFEGSPGGLDMMKDGWLQANAAQMLAKIGQVGVETAIAAAKGQKVSARIDAGSFLVLPSHVDQFAKDSGVAQFMKAKLK
jgi:ribose transport system substrate-binding protein